MNLSSQHGVRRTISTTNGAFVLWTPQSRTAQPALICLPWAGAGAAPFMSWADLAEGVDLWAVRLPGRESRVGEAPHSTIRSAVQELAATFPVSERFALFGHCLGAILAFELARELRRSGSEQPTHLMVVAQMAPAWVSTHPAPVTDVREEVRRLGLTSEEILDNDELFEILRPALGADFGLLDGYQLRPEPPLSVPITAIMGSQDTFLTPAGIRAWERETVAAFQLELMQGDHLFSREAWLELGRRAFQMLSPESSTTTE